MCPAPVKSDAGDDDVSRSEKPNPDQSSLGQSNDPASAPQAPSAASLQSLQQALHEVFAPWVQALQLQVLQASRGEVKLLLPVTAPHVHAGGVLCGQTLMAAADTAMVLAVMTHLGGFQPMSTVQLQTSFLRPVPGDSGSVQLQARVLRMGRKLVFGQIDALDSDKLLVAQTTTTYALL